MPLTIAIDFDRTICDTDNVTPPYKMGPPITGAVEALQRLHEAGHKIIIHSCRSSDGPKAIKVMEDWLEYFKVPYDSVWSDIGKPVADWYIDDKGYYFTGDWEAVLDGLLVK